MQRRRKLPDYLVRKMIPNYATNIRAAVRFVTGKVSHRNLKHILEVGSATSLKTGGNQYQILYISTYHHDRKVSYRFTFNNLKGKGSSLSYLVDPLVVLGESEREFVERIISNVSLRWSDTVENAK